MPRAWPHHLIHLPIHRVAIALLAASLSACAPKAVPPETLVFADPGQPMAGLVYIAEAKGYFRDEHLTLTHRPYTSGRDAIAGVLAGEADVGVATEFPLAKNILEGRELNILATIYHANDNAVLVGRKDRGIHRGADLKGKRIGVTPHTNADYVLSLLLTEAGLNDAAVTRVAVPPERMAQTLAAGEVDAVVTWSPHVARTEARFAEGATVRLHATGYSELALLGARPRVLASRAEAFRRLLRALVRAEDDVADHEAEALRLLARHLGPGQEADLRRAWPTMRLQVRLSNLMRAALEAEADWLAVRATPALAVPDFRARISPQFLEAIRPQAVTLVETN